MSYQVFGNPAFPYGTTSRLYGSGASSDTVTYWTIEVDWDNAGTYSGQSEALYCIGLETQAGRKSKVEYGANGDVIGFKHPDVGTCRITLDNSTRRFDPYYSSGALFGKLLPGRFIRVRATYQGVTYPIFHGNIAKITPYDNINHPTVVLDCEDGKRWLMNSDYNTDGVITNENPANYSLAVARTIYPTRFGVSEDLSVASGYELSYIWSDGDVSAMSMITDLIRAHEDKWYIAEDGEFRIYTNLSGPPSFPSTIASLNISEENTLKQFAVPVPWEEITNVRKLSATPRVAKTDYVMWTGVDAPQLAPTESFTYFPTSTYNNESVPSEIGTATINITANTAADGSGTNLTLFSGVISGADATGCILTVTNNEPTLTGYVTSINLTGTVYAPEPETTTTEDATSIATYGRRRLVLNGRLADDVTKYNYVGNLLGSPTIEIQMQARPDEQFNIPLFYYAAVNLPRYNIVIASGVNRFIAHVSHKWLDQSGQNVLSTFRLEEI